MASPAAVPIQENRANLRSRVNLRTPVFRGARWSRTSTRCHVSFAVPPCLRRFLLDALKLTPGSGPDPSAARRSFSGWWRESLFTGEPDIASFAPFRQANMTGMLTYRSFAAFFCRNPRKTFVFSDWAEIRPNRPASTAVPAL